MDLHVYRNSQDRWHDLRTAARERGAVLAFNAVTFDELVQHLTPDVNTATPGQRLAMFAGRGGSPHVPRYVYDAVSELKAARVRAHELRGAGADLLADCLEQYDQALRQAALYDPQDRCTLAASRVREGAVGWLKRFRRLVVHAIYDLTEAEFVLVRSLIETLPEGGTVVLFNTTANVKPTQFAEWTWQRFIQDESLAEKTFPEFCRPLHPSRSILEKLFLLEPHEPFPSDDWLRIVEASSRYKEVEHIGGDIADLLASGESPNDVAVVVRHIETYGEMLEDVFTRYSVPHRFETGVPLLRVPFIKYWLALADLVQGERSREALGRVMSSVYFSPRLSPEVDVERALASFGYIDRYHISASVLAARKNSPLTVEIERFEKFLDELERSQDTAVGFMDRLQPPTSLTERDGQAWRVLAEEVAAVGALYERLGGRRPPLQLSTQKTFDVLVI
jgi:Exodeoxyribonuclease V, gamma subunit